MKYVGGRTAISSKSELAQNPKEGVKTLKFRLRQDMEAMFILKSLMKSKWTRCEKRMNWNQNIIRCRIAVSIPNTTLMAIQNYFPKIFWILGLPFRSEP